MQLADVLHPLLDLVRVLVCVFDGAHSHVAVLKLLALRAQLQFQHRGVRLVRRGLVEEVQTQSVILAIWPGHLNTNKMKRKEGDELVGADVKRMSFKSFGMD